MAFGKKSAEIQRLQAELTQVRTELARIEPFKADAELIHDKYERYTQDGFDISQAFKEAVKAADEARRHEVVMGIVATLSPVMKLQLLDKFFGDEELKRELETERQRELQRAAREVDIEHLRAITAQEGSINLKQIPAGNKVAINLCSGSLDVRYRKIAPEEATSRRIEGVMADQGFVHVLSATGEARSDKDEVYEHELITFGTPDEKFNFKPVAYFDSEVEMRRKDGDTVMLGLDLMQVSINGQDILLRD